MKHANDNNLTNSFLAFQKDRPLFDWAIISMGYPFIHALKNSGRHKCRFMHERSNANFINFIRFEKEFVDRAAETKRMEIRTVK